MYNNPTPFAANAVIYPYQNLPIEVWQVGQLGIVSLSAAQLGTDHSHLPILICLSFYLVHRYSSAWGRSEKGPSTIPSSLMVTIAQDYQRIQ